ncbi:hypothetical protein Cpin_3574 [Chitinophaga pinensis DSM 2588]|uniref:Uncharacterized protein n=1 Tax=Chitinophaga pinensis (strain ATCC 43595 / DSM 2588 / LMG 13176 / NBRC 15968 / NCIMB 11800 / UQM 2034) TaxID=485918 RepID=A0A979G5K2_CHIPD|nr:hypothetical protein Cpin_3574 [Chitinophaga pinensis DSM 2588]
MVFLADKKAYVPSAAVDFSFYLVSASSDSNRFSNIVKGTF